jgi:hypothetical protein
MDFCPVFFSWILTATTEGKGKTIFIFADLPVVRDVLRKYSCGH